MADIIKTENECNCNYCCNYGYIDENVKKIYENVKLAVSKRRNIKDDISILAVTKTVDVDRINYAISKGIKIIAENKVQELISKYEKINKENIEIHFIGHLQTNKVKYIIDKVSLIHSVDSLKLAEEIGKQAKKLNKVMDILIQINIGNEDTKSGIPVKDIYNFIGKIKCIDNIKVKGFMIIPPPNEQNNKNSKYFKEIYNIFIDIKEKNIDNIDMMYLSSGMSDDYVDAIIEGSNVIRLGTAIFGMRRK